MDALFIDNEAGSRLGVFAAVLAAMLTWQFARPLRPASRPWARRWLANLGLVAVDALVVRLLFPVAAVGAALIAAENGWGLFSAVDAPVWLAIVVSVVVLDAAIYLQHVVFHKVPVLWRLHRVHHTDVDFDATTALRFHPIEIGLSMVFKMVLVVALGAPAAAVILFEVILNAMALFNHGNVSLPPRLDTRLRRVLVTPDMHRVHHSVYRDETDSNFGFNLSIWDRLFGTYRVEPRDGHLGMRIGTDVFRAPEETSLWRLIVQPFRRPQPS